jgi:RimJ/RimL family protein N-acetyltransferase
MASSKVAGVSEVRLESFSRAHLGVIAELAVDPDVQRFTRFPVPVPLDFADVWWSRLEDGRRSRSRESFAVIDEADGRVLGIAGAPRIDHEARTAELGYLIAPAARGRGVATQALGLLTDWALTELRALRLELLISDQNPASRKVAIRCGYHLEGVLRSLHLKDGIRWDTEIWSRLPTDS